MNAPNPAWSIKYENGVLHSACIAYVLLPGKIAKRDSFQRQRIHQNVLPFGHGPTYFDMFNEMALSATTKQCRGLDFNLRQVWPLFSLCKSVKTVGILAVCGRGKSYGWKTSFFPKICHLDNDNCAPSFLRSLCEIGGDCFGPRYFKNTDAQNNHRRIHTMTETKMVQSYYCH